MSKSILILGAGESGVGAAKLALALGHIPYVSESGQGKAHFIGELDWGSPRYNGWDVPLGEACFVFDEDACFTKTTSDEGESLSKAIGHCSITEWSEYSC